VNQDGLQKNLSNVGKDAKEVKSKRLQTLLLEMPWRIKDWGNDCESV